MESTCLIRTNGRNYYLEVECLRREYYRLYDPRVHVHPSYHLILVSKGRNRAVIGNAPAFELEQNTLLFINSLVPHRFTVDPDPGVEHTSMIWRFRDEEGRYAVFPLQQLCGIDSEVASPYITRLLSDFDASLFLHKHHQALKAIHESVDFFPSSMILFELWFLGFNLIMHGEEPGRSDSRSRLVGRIKNIIEWKMIEPGLDIGVIADQIRMHPNYINAVFKEVEGTTINQYLRNKRIELAKTILTNSDRCIGEVADMCGFSQHSYFTRTFHKVCGMSPGEYRSAAAE